MRFAVNENVSATVIRELRARGHDVLAAQAEQRIVVTHDKDFGELAFRYDLPAACGVVLIRLSGANPAADNLHVLAVLESRNDWPGHFSVVERGRVRMRPLPGKASPPKRNLDV